MKRAAAALGARARVVPPASGAFDLSGYDNVAEAVLAIITRHPMGEEELRRALEDWTPGQVEQALQKLIASGEAQIVERFGERFWTAAGCTYPSWAAGQHR